ncbi:MAG: serine kinase [bacterium]|nr:MAG: serine kinase [bacterium]
MTVKEMIQGADLEVKAAANCLDTEVTGGYSGDLISAVIANAEEGNVWITWHVHPNIVAAALVVKLAAIILISGRQPEEETVKKADEEGIPILVSKQPAFAIIGKLNNMGIMGEK